MKLLKITSFATLAALMAVAVVGASSAMAEDTALCDLDPGLGQHEACPAGNLIVHVHVATLPGHKAKLLSPINVAVVECDVLFLGEVITPGALGAPLEIEGNFTYANCGLGCAVEEVNGPTFIEVLKEGYEAAKVVGEGEVHVNCFGINCTYDGEGLTGLAVGALLSEEQNGEVTVENQVLHKVRGAFCPTAARLDILVTPLSAIYIAE